MRIGLIGDNSIEFVKNLLSIWKNSDCVVIIDWRLPASAVVQLLEEAQVAYCYIDENLKEFYQDIKESPVKFVWYHSTFGVQKVPTVIKAMFEPKYNENEALILYSSGTTGSSKGVVLSYGAINMNADAIIEYMHLDKKDSFFIVKTLAHSSTIVGELLVALKTGVDVYVSNTIVPIGTILNCFLNFNISTVCVNPSILRMYCKAQEQKKLKFPSLKNVYVSGSILNANQIIEFENVFPNTNLFNVYGLTEAGPRVAAQSIGGENTKGSVGKAIKGVKIKIVPQADITIPNAGVVYVKTPTLFRGYVSGQNCKVDEDGWLNTEDIGFWDEKENLHIVGRHDDMMIISSHNVFPEPIEKIILQCPGISDCFVYSTACLGGQERIVCEYTSNNELPEKELRVHCAQYLASYEIPSEFVRVFQINYTPNGKKRRKRNGN